MGILEVGVKGWLFVNVIKQGVFLDAGLKRMIWVYGSFVLGEHKTVLA